MKRNIIIAAIVVVVVGTGIFLFMNNNSDDNSETPPATGTSNQTDTSTDNTPADENTDTGDETAPQAVTIIYGDSGFSPNSYTVAAGGMVTVQNNSSNVMEFASNPHPTHTDEPEFNIGEIQPGASKTFTPTKTGTWGFHNHEHDSHGGTLIVE